MSRLRIVSLSVVAAAAVATAGLVMSPATATTASGPATADYTSPPPSGTATSTPTVAPTTPTPTVTPTTPPPTTPPVGEGCTPGFWKNHPDAFAGTGYSPTTVVGSVFAGLPAAYASLTFDEVLGLTGGGLAALLRQAVAALLNASSPEVDYPLTAQQVIALTNAAIASGDYEPTKDLFDQNNNLTAPGFCD